MSGNQAVAKPGFRAKVTVEFNKNAAATVTDEQRTIVDVARSLGLVEQTLESGFGRSVSTAWVWSELKITDSGPPHRWIEAKHGDAGSGEPRPLSLSNGRHEERPCE